MEWAAEAKLGAALGFFLCTALHQAVVREHVSHAHLAFDFVKTHPLCHTWSPFVTCVNTVGSAFTVAKRAENTRPSLYWRGACCFLDLFFFFLGGMFLLRSRPRGYRWPALPAD